MKKIWKNPVRLIYTAFVVFLIGFTIYSYVTPYQNGGFASDAYRTMNEGWTLLGKDETQRLVRLPADLDTKPGEETIIMNTIPEEYYENCKLFIKSSHQNVTVWIDGKIVYKYVYQTTQKINENFVPSEWVAVPIHQEDIGKQITIRYTLMQDDGSVTLNQIYLGEEIAVLYHLVRSSWLPILAAIIMLVLGLMLLLYYFFIREKDELACGYHYMGLYIFAGGMWFMSQCDARQIFFNNISFIRNMEFFSLMLIIIPFILSVDHIEGRQYHRLAYVICLLICLVDMGITVLAFAKVFILLDMLPVLHLTFLAAIIYSAVTFFLIYRRDRALLHKIKWIICGYVVLIFCGLCEMIVMTFFTTDYQSYFLSVGGLVFSILMVYTQARNYRLLQVEKQNAEAKNRAKSEVLTNMSHEIRTPINAVLGMDEMILRESKDEAITEYAQDIQNAGRTLLSIVNDVLDFSKIEAGKMDIVNAEYDLSSVLNDITNLIRFRAEKKNLEFEIHVDESLPSHLIGDAFRIHQVAVNILVNAVKYTKKGKVILTVGQVKTYESGMEVVGTKKRRRCGETNELQEKQEDADMIGLCITVTDTGVGIKEEDRVKLFHQFERLDIDQNRSIEGTGLGLAITSRLVRLMHGTMNVQSTYGKGSTFTIVVPQQIAAYEAIGNFEERYHRFTSTRGSYHETFTAPQAKILVVDDNEINLKLIQGLLKRTQVQVEICTSGQEVLERVRKEFFDVIFMDHLMPEMDGIETLHQMERLPDNLCSGTPVIALTANAISGMKEMYLREGFTDYLSKPIDGLLLEKMLMGYLPQDKISRETAGGERMRQNVGNEQRIENEQSTGENALLDPKTGYTYCMGDQAVYRDILQIFCDSRPEKEGNIRKEYAQEDWNRYKVHVHALKSTALTIGAKPLSLSARELEYAAKRYESGDEPEKALEYIHTHQEETMQLYEDTVKTCLEFLASFTTA